MIVKINGREMVIAQDPVITKIEVMVPETQNPSLKIKNEIKKFIKDVVLLIKETKWLPPPGALLAVVPPTGSGMIEKLWPLVEQLKEFGLVAAIAVSLWGLCRVIMGDKGGKQVIWQAIIGFIGLFILPEIFFAIWKVFQGGA